MSVVHDGRDAAELIPTTSYSRCNLSFQTGAATIQSEGCVAIVLHHAQDVMAICRGRKPPPAPVKANGSYTAPVRIIFLCGPQNWRASLGCI